MKPNLYFIENHSNQPFSYDSLVEKGLGGTESTLLYVAHSLVEYFSVFIVQKSRLRPECVKGVSYLPWTQMKEYSSSHPAHSIILLRSPKDAKKIANIFKTSHRYLWLHDMPDRKLLKYHSEAAYRGFTSICVSKFHMTVTQNALAKRGWNRKNIALKLKQLFYPKIQPHFSYIHNPISPLLLKKDLKVDSNKYLFASAPSKGLNESIELFLQYIKTYNSDAILYLACPEYAVEDYNVPQNDRIRYLGNLSQEQLFRQMETSYCIFFPNKTTPETFGLIFAEANALGTPVLCYDFGAASEVLSRSIDQVVSLPDKKMKILEKLNSWHQGCRPNVDADSRFSLAFVTQQWLALLKDRV